MAVRYTQEQQEKIKDLVRVAEQFADHLLLIMKNHGLDKVDGCRLSINIDPQMLFVTEQVTFGEEETDSGNITLGKGSRFKNEQFEPFGKNSPEYELLFARPAVAERIRKHAKKEKPLPPDGLWISSNRNDAPLDCRGNEIRFDDLTPGKIGGV